MADCVRLYYDGRLMNTILPGSKFKTIPDAQTDTPRQREVIAMNLMQGWIQKAGYERGLFRIEHRKTDPIVLSKMTADIIRLSRVH